MSAKVFLKTRSRLFSRFSRSQSCSNSLNRSSIGYSPKFIEPMFSDASSGLNSTAGRIRSATVMCGEPPVVRLMTASVLRLSESRIGAKCSGFCDGRPSSGSLACMCTTAAPASAAPIAASAISSADTGRCFDIDGVWIAPVTALVMMTFLAAGMGTSHVGWSCRTRCGDWRGNANSAVKTGTAKRVEQR